MIEAARARVASAEARVELVLGDIEALPLEPESVDVVVSNCVINLAPDKRRVFREMHRVLRPGGRFSISDMVTHGRVPDELRRDPELWAGCVSGAAEEKDYLALAWEAGFEDVQVRDSVDYGPLAPGGGECRLLSITVTAAKPRVS
jgi:ubiquinone/menaquinone biosynthesis C-methylase UbiE